MGGTDAIISTLLRQGETTRARPQKGQLGIHYALKCPLFMEEEVDQIWQGHQNFMRQNCTQQEEECDIGKPTLTQYYVSKGVVPKNPLAPEEGMTETLLYNGSLYFTSAESKHKYLELVNQEACWKQLAEMVRKEEEEARQVLFERFDGRVHVNMD